jgi:acetyl-CoA acetyltransferase
MSDTDVFIISVVQHKNSSKAIRQAIDDAGIDTARVQDVIFGLDTLEKIAAKRILSASFLTCSAATVSSSLRAAFFAAQSILSGDVDVVIVVGITHDSSTAILLASPDAVGRWNLMPRARLAARSLNGAESALKAAEIELKDMAITKEGKHGASAIKDAMVKLEQKSERWGMVTMNELALLIERI